MRDKVSTTLILYNERKLTGAVHVSVVFSYALQANMVYSACLGGVEPAL